MPNLNRVGISDQPVTDRPQPEALTMQLRRRWLLWLRWWYEWRTTRHYLLAYRCNLKRTGVLGELSEIDEVGKGIW